MKNKKIIVSASLLYASILSANISGVVYTDYNLNGNKDSNDIVLQGVPVHAICKNGTTYNAVTNVNGVYTLTTPSGEHCRVEADPSNQNLASSSNSAGSSPLVDRVADGTVNHDISVASSGTYCQENPDLLAIAMPTIATDSSTDYYPDNQPTLIKTTQPSEGTINGQNSIDNNREIVSDYSDTGSIWGLAYKKDTHVSFMSASLKPYANLGSAGIGGIYKVAPNGEVRPFITIPNVSSSALDTYLTSRSIETDDSGVYEYIAREGLGDIEISEDQKTLYILNIYGRTLIEVDTHSATIIKTTQLPNPYNTECPDDDVRPWALAVHGDNVYIGSVCESKISNTDGGLGASIQKYNGAIVQEVARTNTLEYLKPYYKNPTKNANGFFNYKSWQEGKTSPMLTDIEIANNGDLILGYTNRLSYIRHADNAKLSVLGGDIRKMCQNNDGSYTDESTTEAVTTCLSHTVTYSNNSETYHEFYIGDSFGSNYGETGHPETISGALVQEPGKPYITVSIIDGSAYEAPGAIAQLSHISGERVGLQALLKSQDNDRSEAFIFGRKAGGLGDIELMCDTAPIEVGNYVWTDTNHNGIQDPSELPIANTPVKLTCERDEIGTTTTDQNGHYYFGGKNNINLYGGYSITPNQACTLCIKKSDINNLSATIKNVNNNHDNIRDNDAQEFAENICINFTTNNKTNHNLDFGILPATFDLALQKKRVNSGPFSQGSIVKFAITVINQGTLTARDIQINDYIPLGLSLHDSSWRISGNTATLKNPISVLTPGSTTTVYITCKVDENFYGTEVINNAEIKSALGGTDIDSHPNSENGSIPDCNNHIISETDGKDDYDCEKITLTPTDIIPTPTPTPTPNPHAKPTRPLNVKVTSVDSGVKLSWVDTSNNENGFKIYQDNKLVAIVAANTESYILTNLDSNTNYTFKIMAFNTSQESSLSIITFKTKDNYGWMIPAVYYPMLMQ